MVSTNKIKSYILKSSKTTTYVLRNKLYIEPPKLTVRNETNQVLYIDLVESAGEITIVISKKEEESIGFDK